MKKLIASLIFASFFCLSCGGSKDAGLNELKVGIVTWGGYAAGLTANGGFTTAKDSLYDKLGIKVTFVVIEDFEKSRAAFRSDNIQLLWGTVDSFSLEYPTLKAVNPVVLFQNDFSRGGDAIAVIDSIQTPADLKGKTVAVAEGTPSHFYVLHVLKNAGLSKDDVKWVFTKGAIDAANAFKSGSVDSCVSWAPDVYMAAKARQGGRILSSTKEENQLIADIFMAKKEFALANKELLKKFMLGWFQGVTQVEANRKEAATLMTSEVSKGFSGVDMDLATVMLDSVYLPTYAENKAFFKADTQGVNFYTLFDNAQAIWMEVGFLKEKTDPAPSVMNELLEELKDEF